MSNVCANDPNEETRNFRGDTAMGESLMKFAGVAYDFLSALRSELHEELQLHFRYTSVRPTLLAVCGDDHRS